MTAQVQVQNPVKQEDPAYVAAMVAKAEGKPATTEPTQAPAQAAAPERPAWLPEKFASPEAMATAYAELEKKLGQGAPKEAPKADDPAAKAAQTEVAQAAEQAVEQAGLDMAALEQKIVQNGQLDDSDYEALQKVGISRQMAESYIAGQRALGEQMVGRLHAHVGGKETFDAIISWAGQNLPAEEAEAFNKIVDTGTEAQLRVALDGLKARYSSAGEETPKLLGGQKAGASGDVYESTAQLTADMRNPLYANDPAFRQKVADKLARSSIL